MTDFTLWNTSGGRSDTVVTGGDYATNSRVSAIEAQIQTYLSRGDAPHANVMTTDLEMGGNKIVNLAEPTDDKDATNKEYVLSQAQRTMGDMVTYSVKFLEKGGGRPMGGDLDMDSHQIKKLATPTDDRDAANKGYVDERVGFRPDGSGNLDMNRHRITNLETPTDKTDATNKEYVLSQTQRAMGDMITYSAKFLEKSGATPMGGDLDMAHHKIKNLQKPTENDEAASKFYVDNRLRSHIKSVENKYLRPNTDLDIKGFKITNVGSPTEDSDVATKRYVDGGTIDNTRYLQIDGTNAMTGHLDMGRQRIKSLGKPLALSDAATKKYVDDNTLDITPAPENNWDAKEKKIVNLEDPTNDQDATTKTYVHSYFLDVDGINTMLADLNVGDNRIVNLFTPVNDNDAATKRYVDEHSGNGMVIHDEHGGTYLPSIWYLKHTLFNPVDSSTLETTPLISVKTGTAEGDEVVLKAPQLALSSDLEAELINGEDENSWIFLKLRRDLIPPPLPEAYLGSVEISELGEGIHYPNNPILYNTTFFITPQKSGRRFVLQDAKDDPNKDGGTYYFIGYYCDKPRFNKKIAKLYVNIIEGYSTTEEFQNYFILNVKKTTTISLASSFIGDKDESTLPANILFIIQKIDDKMGYLTPAFTHFENAMGKKFSLRKMAFQEILSHQAFINLDERRMGPNTLSYASKKTTTLTRCIKTVNPLNDDDLNLKIETPENVDIEIAFYIPLPLKDVYLTEYAKFNLNYTIETNVQLYLDYVYLSVENENDPVEIFPTDDNIYPATSNHILDQATILTIERGTHTDVKSRRIVFHDIGPTPGTRKAQYLFLYNGERVSPKNKVTIHKFDVTLEDPLVYWEYE